MGHARAKLNASGHVEADGLSYRVVDDVDAGRCQVVRDGDGVVIGAFRMGPVGKLPTAEVVEAGALDPDLVLAVARLLSGPRGVLPLQ